MLPDQVKICGINFDVKEVESGSLENDLLGKINFNKSLITIAADMADDLKVMMLIHEILHGIIGLSGVNIGDEESIIRGVSAGIYPVVKELASKSVL